MTAQAPPIWLEDLAAACTSWIFDATGSSETSLFGSNSHNLDTVERRLADFDQLSALCVKSPDLRRNRFIKPTTTGVDGGSTYAH